MCVFSSSAETATFLKNTFGEEDPAELKADAHVNAWRDACASLNTETGDSCTYEDYKRSLEIVGAWCTSMKGFNEALKQLPPEQRKMMEAMMNGGMGQMMGGMMGGM